MNTFKTFLYSLFGLVIGFWTLVAVLAYFIAAYRVASWVVTVFTLSQ